MITYQELYGADSDGNRGHLITEHEIEDSDYTTIHTQVLDQLMDLDPDDPIPETMDIILIDPISEEDITFTIYTKDYQ